MAFSRGTSMSFDSTTIAIIAAILLLAGFVKGVIGFGLPSISMGLLSLLMTPVQAAALLMLPNIVTNIWQVGSGPALRALLLRTAPLLLGTLAGIAATEWATGGRELRWAVRLLGVTLLVYALLGMFSIKFAIPPGRRSAWGWAAGLGTGAMTALTGVYVIPSGPYLQAIGLEKDELVQGLGLAFLTASAGLAAALWLRGVVAPSVAGASALALLPALGAMLVGGKVRGLIPDRLFRRLFFGGLLALGLWLAIKG
jgi:uncharacterized protein